MKRVLVAVLFILFCFSMISFASFPITITDDLGNEVTIQEQPERIISMTPNTTEILFALGLTHRMVGVTDFCNYPEEALQVDSIGGIDAGLEPVLALEPDLVVSTTMNTKETVEQLMAMGLQVIVLNPKRFEDIFPSITLLGEATGKNQEADSLLEDLISRKEALEARLKMAEETPLVFYEVWDDPFMSVNKDTFVGQLITMAGGENLTHDAASEYPIVSLETIIDRNPQVYILPTGHGQIQEVKDITIRTGFELLDAVQNNRISFINQDIILRPGPRIIDGLEKLAQAIHPQLFTD